MKEHKAMFMKLLDEKQKLIDGLWEYLNKKDGEYTKEIEIMKDEIDQMVADMRAQFHQLRKTSRDELNTIEDELNHQRQKMIDNNNKIIDDKFHSHEENESNSVKKRQFEDDYNAVELENLRIENDKNFSSLKIDSEKEIQNCEKTLEIMRAIYQLNFEKLSYNFKVLSEKKEDNNLCKDKLKKEEKARRTIYKNKLDEYNEKNKKFKENNKKLTKQYVSISRQYKELHKKFKHFEKTDIERYNEIKEMNLAEIAELKEKIIKCDKIIHLQQLGVLWEHPKEEDFIDEENDGAVEEEEPEEPIDEQDEDAIPESLIPEVEMHAILNIILRELEFLLDDKIVFEIKNTPSEKEKLLLKMNVIRKVLAVGDPTEMKKLLFDIYTFTRYDDNDLKDDYEMDGLDDIQQGENNDQNRDGSEDNNNVYGSEEGAEEYGYGDDDGREEHNSNRRGRRNQDDDEYKENDQDYVDITTVEQKYNPNELIAILEKFIDERKNDVVLNSADYSKKKKIEKIAKEMSRKKERKYWYMMSRVLPPERMRMWKVLDKISSQYYQLLLDRQKEIEETTQLHTQNDELKNLLNQYLKVNHNLLIPPTQTINVNFLE